jgi:hypothetical protein
MVFVQIALEELSLVKFNNIPLQFCHIWITFFPLKWCALKFYSHESLNLWSGGSTVMFVYFPRVSLFIYTYIAFRNRSNSSSLRAQMQENIFIWLYYVEDLKNDDNIPKKMIITLFIKFN